MTYTVSGWALNSTPTNQPYVQIGGLEELCKLPGQGLGRSPSRNQISCILALKYDISWQQLTIFLRINLPNFVQAYRYDTSQERSGGVTLTRPGKCRYGILSHFESSN